MQSSFYKLKDYRVICGVCAGISDKFNWDIVVVRLFTVLLCYIWKYGIFVYIILALVLPEKELLEDKRNTSEDENIFNADYDIKDESETK